MRGFVGRLAIVLMLGGVIGCGGESDKRDKVIVKGSVSVDGKPMGGVTLAFFSPGEKVAVGTVTTQENGSYEVMFKAHAGEGNYKVTATKIQAKPGAKTIEKGEGIDDLQLQIAAGAGGGAAGPVNQLPDKYATVEKTELTAVLQKGTNDGKNFEIRSAKK